jgi:hypothetical protein
MGGMGLLFWWGAGGVCRDGFVGLTRKKLLIADEIRTGFSNKPRVDYNNLLVAYFMEVRSCLSTASKNSLF